MIDTDNAPDTERPVNREEYELAACIATPADTIPPGNHEFEGDNIDTIDIDDYESLHDYNL